MLANGQRREKIRTARALLNVDAVSAANHDDDESTDAVPFWLTCPACGHRMRVIEVFGNPPRHRGGDPPRD